MLFLVIEDPSFNLEKFKNQKKNLKPRKKAYI